MADDWTNLISRPVAINSARAKVIGLRTDFVDAKPQQFDFLSLRYQSYWTWIEGVECDECGNYVVGAGDHMSSCSRLGAGFRNFRSAEGPQMQYRYPLNSADYGVDNGRKIANLPLCLIDSNDGVFLALTGGGMDLSWEICEGYLRLGYLPPAHFELPAMADKFLNERTALVMAGMERSCALLADWMTNRRLRTTEMLENLPMREDR